jgi:gamma-glutamyltranspeptidase/glutathione hydrolase
MHGRRFASHRALLVTAAACMIGAFGLSVEAAAPPPLKAKKAAVAADHPLASRAGVEVLKKGGNAVDAACAVAFALGVVNPAGSGIGGGGFMLVARPGKKTVALDFRERAPKSASRNMYIKAGVSKTASRLGGLAVGVPGEVAGCAEAVRRFGKLSLRQVVAPAVRLARGGFPVGHHLAKKAKAMFLAKARFKVDRTKFKRLTRMLQPRGKPLALGQPTRRPKLANALAAIGRSGGRAFYRGWIAKDIVSSIKVAGGQLSLQDLASYKVIERKPLTTSYRGHTVIAMPPPSSGGVAIIGALNILRAHELRTLGHNSSRYLHLLAETLKHVFADRARFLGDTDHVNVPLTRLLAQRYANSLRARIGHKARPIKDYGSKSVPKAPSRDSGTSHISVIDRAGMAVSMTTSINTPFGSFVVTKKSGVILNNTMDDFAAQPGKPNAFGLMQSEQNAVASLKRPLSSMSPTIVKKGDKVRLAVGGSGGPTIITGTLQVLLNVVDFGLNPSAAVARSRIHHQWLPDRLWVEADLPRDVTEALRRRHGQKPWLQKRPFTAIQAITADSQGLQAASDPRKAGYPAGY